MEIFHIMYFLDYGQSFGGAVNTLLQRALLMKKAGQKITVVVSDYLNTRLEEGYSNICAVQNINMMRLTYQISTQPEDIDIVSVVQNYDTVKRAIEEIKPDILHSVQLNPIVELVSRELQIPHVMDIYQLTSDFFRIGYMDLFPHYHICDSEYYAEKWKHFLNTESVCIRTAVNCAGNVAIRHFEKKEELTYLCVGLVCERKNQLEVIKAFHIALQHNVKGRLLIYGYANGGYSDRCRSYIKENGLEESICMKGFCDKMDGAYRDADVLICGSTRESYPNVISEAMCYGLVIITTPVAGVPEVIRNHENGYLCRGYLAEDISEKILELEEDRKKGAVEEILKCAYDTFEKYHSSEHITVALLNYYRKLADTYTVHSNILIGDVRKRFTPIIMEYECKREMLSEPELCQRKLWYIYHIRELLLKQAACGKRKIYIWGTGKYGKRVKEIIDVFWDTLELEGFLDTYKTGEFLGAEIYSPYSVLDKQDALILIAAVNGQGDMIRLLEEKHKEYCEDYFILSPRT